MRRCQRPQNFLTCTAGTLLARRDSSSDIDFALRSESVSISPPGRARAEGEGEMIPTWLVQFGSLAGLLAFCVTIWDRLLSSRPIVWISPGDYGRQVHCKNLAICDITIRTIRCYPSHISVASSDSLNAIVRASAGMGFMAILKADQEREFPLIFRRGKLLNDDCEEFAPFVMTVSWRRNNSYWLPQIPKVIFSSAKAMRALKSAK
jgi:hypothetical protein